MERRNNTLQEQLLQLELDLEAHESAKGKLDTSQQQLEEQTAQCLSLQSKLEEREAHITAQNSRLVELKEELRLMERKTFEASVGMGAGTSTGQADADAEDIVSGVETAESMDGSTSALRKEVLSLRRQLAQARAGGSSDDGPSAEELSRLQRENEALRVGQKETAAELGKLRVQLSELQAEQAMGGSGGGESTERVQQLEAQLAEAQRNNEELSVRVL